MSVRFIHTADLHLGATFSGLSSSSENIGSALKDAVGAAFRAIIDRAINEDVDFVIIAGDIFDSKLVPYGIHRDFINELERLGDAGIMAYLCTGNHDPLSEWGQRLTTLPSNTVMFDADQVQRIEHKRDGQTVAVLYGRSFLSAREPDDFSADMKPDPHDPISIGVLHTSVDGGEPYAPSTLSQLKSAGMDYWALGHIHKTAVLSLEPPIIYPGSPQGLNINETSVHGCYLVELEEGSPASVEFIPTQRIRWERFSVDCSPFSLPGELEKHLIEYADDLLSRSEGSICARVTLTGRSELHKHLREPGILEEMQKEIWGRCMTSSSWFWIDRIIDSTQPLLDEQKLKESELFAAQFFDTIEKAKGAETRERMAAGLKDEVYRLAGRTASADVSEASYARLLELAKTCVLDELTEGVR